MTERARCGGGCGGAVAVGSGGGTARTMGGGGVTPRTMGGGGGPTPEVDACAEDRGAVLGLEGRTTGLE